MISEEYIRNVIILHKLIADGKEDSIEADPIRDKIVLLENSLTPEDLDIYCYLAGDLYICLDESLYVSTTDEEKSELINELNTALKNGQWLVALKALRYNLGLSEVDVARQRGIAWSHFSEEIGNIFFDFVAKIERKDNDRKTS